MPGVTVDASSDVLMERVRSAATDGAGRFVIVGLRAGTHIVTTSRRTATSGNRVSCVSPEAAYALPTPVQQSGDLKWTSTVTNRLLVEVGASFGVASPARTTSRPA